MVREQQEIRQEYECWMKYAQAVPELFEQLKAMETDETELSDAFYKDLEFGTGGLRGIMGAGTNRMNIYTVSKASRGVASYVEKYFPEGERSAAIAYDSRINSRLFAEKAAEILASRGIHVNIYSELMPTPMLSWAVRQLKCSVGIVITASHNPAKYNGYKVYGSDGCQITNDIAKMIFMEIEESDYFKKSGENTFEYGVKAGDITYIEDIIIDSFVEEVKHQSLLKEEEKGAYRELSIVYTPLNGAGFHPVLRTLKVNGFQNVFVVPEQKLPDGHFPTCPVPNPEDTEALELGIRYAKERMADILIATDPDCDRVGVAVPEKDGSYKALSGNETGVLLLDYVCKKRLENGTMPENPVFIKSIVTTDLAERVAEHYGVRTVNLLTGFKYIGEQIGKLEEKGRKNDFIFGFEESFGYLSGEYVRDKDGVGAAYLICEMAAYYKRAGKTLLRVLEELYGEYGYYLNKLHTYRFEGADGTRRMERMMERVRKSFEGVCKDERAEERVCAGRGRDNGISYFEDYYAQRSFDGCKWINMDREIPRTNMVKLRLGGDVSVIIRPSGTEPKVKVYVSVRAKGEEKTIEKERIIMRIFETVAGI